MLDHSHPQITVAVLLLLTFAATLLAQARSLPAQNVAMIAALIMLISGVIQTIGVKTGVPFGRYFYTESMGPELFHLLPWPVPLLWVVIVLNSRGVTRLILRPWRTIPNYGYWSIGLTCFLAVLFDASLEPFASRANHFWIWQTPRNVPAWYGAPWVNFASWGAATLLILGITTPWLINKKPAGEVPPDYWPLVIWLFLMLILVIGSAIHELWRAAEFGLMTSIMVSVAAWRNSRLS